MGEIEINFIAIAAAAVANMLVGMVWYNPKVFGAKWMQWTGKTEEECKESCTPMTFVWVFVLSVLTAVALTVILQGIGITSFGDAVPVVIVLWLGFVVATQVEIVLWEFRPMNIANLYMGKVLVSLLVMVAVLLAL